MRRLQILIEEDLAAAVDAAARRERVSKGALIRRIVRERLQSVAPLETDPLWQMAGADDYEPSTIDDVACR
jgi:metal-responsive CopG/Arc/MetJ family transcriptional regulator